MACRSATAAVTANKTKQTKHKIQGSNTHNSWIKKKKIFSKIEPARNTAKPTYGRAGRWCYASAKDHQREMEGRMQSGKMFLRPRLGESIRVRRGKGRWEWEIGQSAWIIYTHVLLFLFFTQKKNIKKEHFEYCFYPIRKSYPSIRFLWERLPDWNGFSRNGLRKIETVDIIAA